MIGNHLCLIDSQVRDSGVKVKLQPCSSVSDVTPSFSVVHGVNQANPSLLQSKNANSHES